ncbi:MAG: transcription antitermination factor NusB [Proteobacteria bacterium]|nr:transcription antitermination factor NusB [Pseudomonadota bacterium]
MKRQVSPSTEGRRVAMLFLYKCEADGLYFYSPSHLRSHLGETFTDSWHLPLVRKIKRMVRSLTKNIFFYLPFLDHVISQHSENWSLIRLHAVDRAVLRVACYELCYRNTPRGVVISDALDMAKEYGSKDSPAFVHGVLDAIAKSQQEP